MSRIEYIQYALQADARGREIIPLAKEIERFVMGGPPVVANGFFVPFDANDNAIKVDGLNLREGEVICDDAGAFWRVSRAK